MIEVGEIEAPAIWASALINGDLSGLDYCGPEAVEEFEEWLATLPDGLSIVDCSEEPHIGRFAGLQTELLTYTTHTYTEAT